MMFSRLFKEMVSVRDRILFLSGEFSRTLPCGVVLTGILCVLLPAFLLPGAELAVILIPPLASLAALWCFGPRDAAFKFALPCLLAMFSLIWHTERYERDPVAAFAQERPRIGAIGELTVIDPSICGPRLRWMPVPGNILCRLDRAKYSSYGVWHKIDGLVMVRLPKEHPPLVYGGKLLAEGVLEQPEPPLFPGTFDYGEYLKNRGIRYLFRLTEPPEMTGRETGFMSGLLSIRDFLLGRILSPVASDPDKTLCAAMLFGCRQGIEYQTRLDFIRSGTIHILTVSGLHIGMFAGVMFLLLAFLPFRVRCVIVPLLTALYALSTGLQMPAFRALAMLCTWCFMRAFLLRGSVLNAVFMACAILLIWNPRQLMDPGFQYSFTAVIFLVASLPLTSEWTSMLFEKMRWVPADHIPHTKFWRLRFARMLFASLSGCIIAWLASFGLTLIYQGITVPFSVLTNLLILPLSWLCFFVFCLGSLIGFLIPPSLAFSAYILNLLSAEINGICSFFSRLGEFIRPVPQAWSVLLSLALLMVILRSPSKKTVLRALALLGIILFFWCTDPFHTPEPETAVIAGGNLRRPAVLLSVPEYDFSVLVNASDFSLARDAAAYLKRRGHASLSYLILTSGQRSETYGAKYLFPVMRVDNLVMVKPSFNAVAAKEAYATAYSHDVRTSFLERCGKGEYRYFSQKVKTFVKNDDLFFEFSHFDFKITMEIKHENGSIRAAVYDKTGKLIDSLSLPVARERSFSVLTVQKAS